MTVETTELQNVEPAPEPARSWAGSAVATLMNRDDLADFFAVGAAGMPAWLERPFRAHGPVARLRGLVDFDFDDICAMPRAFTKAFWRGADGKHRSERIGIGDELDLYQAGRTIYWHSLRSPSIDEWIAEMELELGFLPGATRVSAFASRKGPGLRPHYDPNDNFCCQARGVKRWRYTLGRGVRFPTSGQTMGAELGFVAKLEAGELPAEMPEPVETVDMKPGSVMVMPRGIWHATETLEPSIHFNIQCGLPTWKDALDFVLARKLHGSEACRSPILDGNEDVLEAGFKERFAALAKEIAEGKVDLDVEAFRKFVARRKSA